MSDMTTNAGRADREGDRESLVLGILNAIDGNSQVTQRTVAQELGIALGLANAYMKRCARKGLIKISQAPARRYAYYLTPKGFSEKSRLTAKYLGASLTFFRRARNECTDLLRQCSAGGHTRIALAGLSDLVDVLILCARDYSVDIVGVIDARTDIDTYQGLRVVPRVQALLPLDAVIVTDLTSPQATFDRMSDLGLARVVAPPLLRLTMPPMRLETGDGDA